MIFANGKAFIFSYSNWSKNSIFVQSLKINEIPKLSIFDSKKISGIKL